MSFTIIREERITHSGNGLQIEDDFYIKLDAAFDELLPELGRSSELPALLHIQLREAYASSGRGNPATLKTIAHAASCEERQARRIVKSLLGKCLIADAGVSPETGEKLYRPIGYAWFGHRNNRSKSGVSSMTPPNGETDKSHPPVSVVVDVVQNQNKDSMQQQYNTRTREILRQCGILGRPLNVLSESVSPQTALAWKEWLENPPKHLRSPIGVAVNALLADPDARPTPVRRAEEQTPKTRKPGIQGKLAAKFAPQGEEP